MKEDAVRPIFREEANERDFKRDGYVVFDLLDEAAIEEIWSFYVKEFRNRREVFEFARPLPYYISIFDTDRVHKERVDALISKCANDPVQHLMLDYEIFYSNFMIKFGGDGQIEAHQDFNFVDESKYTAFNLWCPLVDTGSENGGLYVIPGSHLPFRTQRGPNIPKALTEYNEILQRYSVLVPLRKGQAIVFDHKLVHYSPPNNTEQVRVAIQSVLKPKETPALHYFYQHENNSVQAYRIDKKYVFESNLWEADIKNLPLDHEEDLIPFPTNDQVIDGLIKLKLNRVEDCTRRPRPIFRDDNVQSSFEENGFVKFAVLDPQGVQQLRKTFADMIGEDVKNSDYGMYISLEEPDQNFKTSLIENISAVVLPRVQEHFQDCKSHLGSFLVKASGINSYSYPHQDWTFVDAPEYCSVTVWIALVDIDENNGALGFIKGSHKLFDKPVGSPSPDFQTLTQGHEDILYEYLEFIPLKAGEAIAFDNRTIHGAPPNLTNSNRVAVAIGMTAREAPLYHFYILPSADGSSQRRIAKFRVDQEFFHKYSVASLKQLFEAGQVPDGYEIESVSDERFHPLSRWEIEKLCQALNIQKNGKRLTISQPPAGKNRISRTDTYVFLAKDMAHRLWKRALH